MKKKRYTNKEKDEYECLDCHTIRPAVDFFLSDYGTPRCYCKVCTRKRNRDYKRKKEAAA